MVNVCVEESKVPLYSLSGPLEKSNITLHTHTHTVAHARKKTHNSRRRRREKKKKKRQKVPLTRHTVPPLQPPPVFQPSLTRKRYVE